MTKFISFLTQSYDATFEEKCFCTFVNIHAKQTCGFLPEILSIQTSFRRKRLKKGKWSNQCLQVALFHEFYSNSHCKTKFMIEIMPLLALFDDYKSRKAKFIWIDFKSGCLFVV